MTQNRIAAGCLLASALLLPGILLPAHAAVPQTIPGLGTTTFPTSTSSPEAETAFMRGLLLLHLFEYPDAAQAFSSAQKLDPAFSMAYWGEAMTHNHGVWNQLDAAAGKAALDKFAPTAAARASRISDPRERAYMAAVELLYDGRGTKVERDKLYAQAMKRLTETFRSRQERKTLSMLCAPEREPGGNATYPLTCAPPRYRRPSSAWSLRILEPPTTGFMEWTIPITQPGRLKPPERSKIAPDAGHAQHMCSHIFIALGMWDDVVQANVEAMRVVTQQGTALASPPPTAVIIRSGWPTVTFSRGASARPTKRWTRVKIPMPRLPPGR